MTGPMPWVIAIMMFLTILATAAGLALGGAARMLGQDLAGMMTIQIVEPNPVSREVARQRITAELAQLSSIGAVRNVPSEEIAALLEPMFGATGLQTDLPVPALIDVELRRATPATIGSVAAIAREASPTAQVIEQVAWLRPVADLLHSLRWLALGLVMLLAIATSATVVLAVRAALNTLRATIDVMHLLGSTDAQVAALFQRRVALDALLGGFAGLAVALLAIALIGQRLGAVGAGLIDASTLGWSDWVLIAVLPVAGAVLATLCARLTVLRALRRSL